MTIRHTTTDDLRALEAVLEGTGLFPAEMLEEMFTHSQGHSLWLTAEADGNPVGFCYATPEPMTDGTWNMLAIAVLPTMQGKGLGGELTDALETRLRAEGHRILIADTSGTEDFALTRAFYAKHGYDEESRIRDFWDAGDDKVTFRKALL